MLHKKVYDHPNQLIGDSSFHHDSKNVIICSVTDSHKGLIQSLSGKNKVILFESTTPIPIKNLYQNASTLGSDRLAASIGSFALYPDQNVLTIDAGTCIKYNFVNSNNEYIGGAISPGLSMRLLALHKYTNKLPEIEPDYNYEKLTGQNTRESMLSGALMGAAAEVDECINRYRLSFPNLTVVVSGGDAAYLCKQVKNRIFAHPDIVLSGLNTILNYNLEK
ncbi:MAG: type III pantothenate kinase [Bacteroidia bacterium]